MGHSRLQSIRDTTAVSEQLKELTDNMRATVLALMQFTTTYLCYHQGRFTTGLKTASCPAVMCCLHHAGFVPGRRWGCSGP